MNNNWFEFNDTLYQQIEGLAMGTPAAPTIATIYGGVCEQQWRPREDKEILLYARYIDGRHIHAFQRHSIRIDGFPRYISYIFSHHQMGLF